MKVELQRINVSVHPLALRYFPHVCSYPSAEDSSKARILGTDNERGTPVRASVIASFIFCLLLTATISVSHALDISLIGADPGPNATGEIPAWEGHKNMPCPSDYTQGAVLPKPVQR